MRPGKKPAKIPLYVQSIMDENDELKKEIRRLNEKLSYTSSPQDTLKYSLLGEIVHLRRMMEYDGDLLKEQKMLTEKQKVRADKAERELFNLKKWMSIKGIDIKDNYE